MSNSQTTMPVEQESFALLFEESVSQSNPRVGEVISAEVVRIDHNFVVVNAGLKSEAFIPKEEFHNDQGEMDVEIGDFVSVAIDSLENGYGDVVLSRDKAKRLASWMRLEQALESGELIIGTVTGKVKGGLTVIVDGIRAFLPGSLIDVRPIKDTTPYENKTIEFKVIKLDRKRNNVVLSRRAVIEASMGEERQKLIESLQEGTIVKGIIKNITDYGAFVDLGGIDGLLHITDLAWRRVKHPSEMLQQGQEVEAKILRFDQEKNRVSLGIKQLGNDPWVGISARYPTGTRLEGRVTNLTDYGAFVEIESGIEGLVHVSEMDWTNKNVTPSKVVQIGDEIDVMVLEINEEVRRISLGIKQCLSNPWANFSQTHQVGQTIRGNIRSITDFGIFISLDGGIDGLIHASDLSWTESEEDAIRKFKKGEEIEAVLLTIDTEKERIALGVKQLSGDPFNNFVSVYERGSNIMATVTEVEEKGAHVELVHGVKAYLRSADMAQDVKDMQDAVKVGDKLEVMVSSIDKKNQVIHITNRALETQQQHTKAQEMTANTSGTTNLGALLKAKLNG